MDSKAKDTVMSEEQLIEVIYLAVETPDKDADGGWKNKERFRAACKAQAEISFKAGLKEGIWLFAWWKDGVQYVGTSGRTLEEAYKELGLDSTHAK